MANKILSSVDLAGQSSDLGNDQIRLQAPPLTAVLTRASTDYNERLVVFSLLEQLNHLCRAVQRHRGYSMGLLAGNKSFATDFYALQKQMKRRIQLISAFAAHSPSLLNHTDLERLHYAWNTIRDNWQDDSVLENFEFHSHSVDQLLVMMARLLERIRQPYGIKIRALLASEYVKSTPDEKSVYQRLLAFSHHKLPRFIELLGKVRALSVHAAATGHCEEEYEKKLVYLLQCIGQEREKIFFSVSELQGLLNEQLPTLLTIKTYEYKLDFLLEKIQSGILGSTVITLKEEEVFGLATDIIDIYWRVVDDGLRLLSAWQKEDLESWLLEG